jgi:hypothetical protein
VGIDQAQRCAAPVLTMRREITLYTQRLTMQKRKETVLPTTCFSSMKVTPMRLSSRQKDMAGPVEVVGLNYQLNRAGRQISWSSRQQCNARVPSCLFGKPPLGFCGVAKRAPRFNLRAL